jgi:hypothetical protein
MKNTNHHRFMLTSQNELRFYVRFVAVGAQEVTAKVTLVMQEGDQNGMTVKSAETPRPGHTQ